MVPDPDRQSVLAFGAEGDGSADDTAAVRRAVEDGAGGVRFPAGTYRLTDTVEVDLDATGPVSVGGDGTATVRMEAAGPAFRFVGTHDGTANPDSFEDAVWDAQRMPTLDGLEIVGGHPDAVGVEATNTMQLTLTRLLVREARHGVHLRTRNRNVVVDDCHLYDNAGIGVYLDAVDLHQINVTGSHISYNDGGGVVVHDGNVRNLQVSGCDIESNMSADGPPTGNVAVELDDGSMREGAVVGCTLQHTADAPDSANVRLVGRGTDDRRKVGNVTVAENALSDARHNVLVRYGRGVVVAGNVFWKGYDHDVLIEESSNVVLGPNLLDRNPDYGPGGENGVVIRDSHDLTVDGLHVNGAAGPAGIVLENCRNYGLRNATLVNCDGGGLLLSGTERGIVSSNAVHDDRPDDRRPPAITVTGGRENFVATNYAPGGIDVDAEEIELGANFT